MNGRCAAAREARMGRSRLTQRAAARQTAAQAQQRERAGGRDDHVLLGEAGEGEEAGARGRARLRHEVGVGLDGHVVARGVVGVEEEVARVVGEAVVGVEDRLPDGGLRGGGPQVGRAGHVVGPHGEDAGDLRGQGGAHGGVGAAGQRRAGQGGVVVVVTAVHRDVLREFDAEGREGGARGVGDVAAVARPVEDAGGGAGVVRAREAITNIGAGRNAVEGGVDHARVGGGGGGDDGKDGDTNGLHGKNSAPGEHMPRHSADGEKDTRRGERANGPRSPGDSRRVVVTTRRARGEGDVVLFAIPPPWLSHRRGLLSLVIHRAGGSGQSALHRAARVLWRVAARAARECEEESQPTRCRARGERDEEKKHDPEKPAVCFPPSGEREEEESRIRFPACGCRGAPSKRRRRRRAYSKNPCTRLGARMSNRKSASK